MTEKPKCRVNFWFEWGPPAYLWTADAYAIDQLGIGPLQDRLPLSDELRKRGEKLSDWFQGSLNWDYPPDPGPWRQEECERFKIAARAFFADLQQEIGAQYDLIYCQAEPDEDPDLDEYLKDPLNFRRSKS